MNLAAFCGVEGVEMHLELFQNILRSSVRVFGIGNCTEQSDDNFRQIWLYDDSCITGHPKVAHYSRVVFTLHTTFTLIFFLLLLKN